MTDIEILESTYFDKCTIKRKEKTKNPNTGFSVSCIGEGNGNPLQCSCLENPRDRRAWWAAVYGVA